MLAVLSFAAVEGSFVKVPGETDESLRLRWPGERLGACSDWAQGEPGYELRRLTTRRPKFFAEERDKTLKRSMQWSVLAECPTTSWTIRLLNASALADRDAGGETELASVIQEVLSTSLLKTLSSGLSFFGLLSLAGRRKKRARAARAPVVWDLFTELPHWSPLQRSLWKAIRTRRPLPLSAVILQLEADKEHLTKAVSLLTAAQEIRLRSGDILPASHIFLEVDALLRRAAHILKLWVDEVSQDTMIAGLREWPVVQLLADLEVSDLAQLQAIGRHFATQQMVRFLPSPEVVPNVVLPFREPLSDHDRDIGKFHCTSDFFTEVEHWKQSSHPESRLTALEVACWLPDCLIWAGHRLQGRISAACLEADDLATLAGRRSIKLNGFEGQVHMLQRRVTGSPSVQWHCRAHDNLQHQDNIEENVHLSNDRRCGFKEVTGLLQRDDLARSIDDEVLRLGFEQLDILKLSISSMDILRSAKSTLSRTKRVLLATDPRDTMMQAQLLRDAGFQEIHLPTPDKSRATPYSSYVIGRRS